MKTLVIITFIVFSAAHSFSQDKLNLKDFSDKTTYFTISYLAGTSFTITPAFNKSTGIPVGYNGGIEIGYYPPGSITFFMNFNISRLNNRGGLNNYKYSEDAVELTMGPRIYFDNKKTLFIEGAIGTYIFSETTFFDHYSMVGDHDYYSVSSPGMGFEIGCGKDFKLSKGMTLTLKTKLHDAFPELKSAMYMGVYSAISFDSRDNLKSKSSTRTEKDWVLTLLGGISNPEFFYNRSYKWGINLGVDAAFRASPKVEYYLSAINNKIVRNINYFGPYNINNYILEVTTGPRFILNLNKISPFLDMGIGLYGAYSTSESSYHISNNFSYVFGTNFGTGLLINLTKSAGLITRGKMNFLFSNTPLMTSYLAVSTGVRVYL